MKATFKNKNVKIKNQKKKKYIFGGIVIIAVLHLVFMALPMISRPLSKKILGYEYGVAVLRNQEIDQNLDGVVIKIVEPDLKTLKPGDYILINNYYNDDYYWELKVIENHVDDQIIKASFDEFIRHTYTYDQIDGIYHSHASFIGIFYYTATTPRGFIMMVFLHGLIIYISYYYLFKNQKEEKKHEVLENS